MTVTFITVSAEAFLQMGCLTGQQRVLSLNAVIVINSSNAHPPSSHPLQYQDLTVHQMGWVKPSKVLTRVGQVLSPKLLHFSYTIQVLFTWQNQGEQPLPTLLAFSIPERCLWKQNWWACLCKQWVQCFNVCASHKHSAFHLSRNSTFQ